jgi:hypothetical protein
MIRWSDNGKHIDGAYHCDKINQSGCNIFSADSKLFRKLVYLL